jgi:DNA polymerase-3 subunit gamma/tau
MLSESLAVAYRPYTLEDMVGQPAVVTQITGILNSRKIPRSLLISGATGNGKTTLARMIARYLNCETESSCGSCISCKMGDSNPDIIEVNVGDLRGIDDVRGMIASSRNMPRFKYRVYILDEVHQQTNAGQNALLKSLEEPPAKTIWILATTNPEKLLPTIVGRCFKLPLKSITEKAIMERLQQILVAEQVDLKPIPDSDATLRLISSLSNGSMRNAISLLENMIYAIRSGATFDSSTVLNQLVMSGEADADKMAVALLLAVINRDIKAVLKSIRSVDSTRTLHSKLKWLTTYVIDDFAGVAKFAPYSGRLFKQRAAKAGVKIDVMRMLMLLERLVVCEQRFNLGFDESLVLMSSLGDFIAN